MNKKTNWLSLLATALLLPACGSSSSSKEHYSDSDGTDGLVYELNEEKNGYIVTASLTPEKEIKIPELYQGLPVREIGDEAFMYEEIDSLSLPRSLRKIGRRAFFNLSDEGELKEIDVPEGVTSIGEEAIAECYGLTSIGLPSTLKEIGESAFALDTSLQRFRLPKENHYFELKGSILYSEDFKILYTYPLDAGYTAVDIPEEVEEIKPFAFYGDSAITSFEIGKNVKKIGDRALGAMRALTSMNAKRAASLTILGEGVFRENSKLTSIELPSTIQEFGPNLFAKDTFLASVKLNFDYDEIPEGMFLNCGSLTSLTPLPDQVTSIGDDAFSGCSRLSELNFPSSLKRIGESAFVHTALETVNLPEGLEEIGKSAFRNCTALKKIALPSTLTSLGEASFGYITTLTEADCSKIKITDIPDSCFAGDSALTSLSLPSALTSIGAHAFQGTAIPSIELPDGFKKLGEYAFYDAPALSKVFIPASTEFIGVLALVKTGPVGNPPEVYFEASSFVNEDKTEGEHYGEVNHSDHVHFSTTREAFHSL